MEDSVFWSFPILSQSWTDYVRKFHKQIVLQLLCTTSTVLHCTIKTSTYIVQLANVPIMLLWNLRFLSIFVYLKINVSSSHYVAIRYMSFEALPMSTVEESCITQGLTCRSLLSCDHLILIVLMFSCLEETCITQGLTCRYIITYNHHLHLTWLQSLQFQETLKTS